MLTMTRPNGELSAACVPACLVFICITCLFLSAFPASANEIPWASRFDLTATFDRAFAVHAADVDGDGDIDVLAAAEADDTLAWWENTAGDGTAWTERPIVTDLRQTRKVFTGDFDGDGDIDVAGITEFFQDIRLYLNDLGDGTSWTEVTVDDDVPFACSVFTSDIDQDGDIDIIGGGKRGSHVLSWWENDGTGTTWTENVIQTNFTGPCSVAIADFDKDGELDVAGGAEFLDEVAWFKNPGDGSSPWAKTRINLVQFNEPKAVAAGDIDGDGDPDVIGAAEMGNSITWFENTSGDGTTWTEHAVDNDFAGAHDVFLSDLDGDGDLDALAASPLESPPNPIGAVTWWDNVEGDGSVWRRHDVDGTMGGARGVWAADVDGDGLLDALGAGENDRVSWWRNESIHRNAAWPEDRSIDSSFNEARGITVVDLDHDADLDVIASGGDVVQWWRNDDGVGESWSSQSALANSFVGAQGVDSGDLDGDGDPDAVGAAETDSVVSWFDNTAGDASAWTEKTIDPSFGGARSVVIGDVDGDGDPDVAGAASTDGEFAWWSNTNGDATTWSKTSISGVLGVTHAGAASIFLADFDGDSDLDVAAASSVDEEILFFENTSGDGSTWASTTVDASLDGASSVWAADFDGDGDYDIAAAATDGGDLTWYENTVGDGSAWTRAFVVENLIAGPTDLVAADFDQDGDQDIAATESLAGGSVVWFANTSGDGSTWSTARTLLDPADGAAALDVGDVDRNGTADLVVAVEVDDDLTLLSNLGGQFGLDTADISPSGLGNGVTEDLFRVVARHNGLVGEQDMELATLELLLEETPGDPLTTNEAQAILQNAFVYVDDGNGLWSAVDDTLVTTVPRGSILLDEGGVFSIPFGDGDANVRVQQAAPRTYFVILETTANFTSRGLFSFRATHLTESSSTAEDRVNDVPLRLEWARNVNSSLFDVNPFGTPEADLTLVSIEDAPDPVVPEGTVTYTVTVRNGGDWKAENVRVTNTLPGGTSFVSTSGCAEDPAGSATCTLGDISLLDTASFDITVSLDPGTAGPLIYQASASSDTPEANMGDESDTESTLVQSNEADVGIRVATLAGSYAQGVQTVQAVTVFNSGPGDEADASVTVTFPPELENLLWVCEGFGGASCGVLSGTGVLNSVSVSIPDDDFVIFWVQATAADSATGALTTTATVAGTNDFNASNDTASESVEDGDFVFGDDFESEDTTGWSGTTGGTF